MSFKFITVVLCLFCNLSYANNNSKGPQASPEATSASLSSFSNTVIIGKIFERHLMQNGDWNLLVEIKNQDQTISGWVYYNPETDYKSWQFFDTNHDLTKNMVLAESLEIQNNKPNSELLKATPKPGQFELVNPLAEEDDYRLPVPAKTNSASEERKSDYPLVPDHKNWGSGCANFIDEQGNINAWGLTVIEAVNRYPEYLNSISQDMLNYCPNFIKFNKAEKENFWVWFIAAMAMRESGCRPDAKAKGPNGIAAGLLQLHLHKEYAYHKDCKTTNALEPQQNLSCGSAMFDTQLIRYNRMFLARGSYWEVLQTDSSGNGVRKLIAQYRPCH
jgi:hypothetical protein